MTRPARLLWLILPLCTAACSKPEPVVYTAPKETPVAPAAMPMPLNHPAPAGNSAETMARQTLPAEAVATSDTLPAWTLPDTWEAGPANPMRKASFSASGDGGTVNIAITAFPGDVGGRAANINRWRQQIGLPALPPAQAEALPVSVPTAGAESADWVELSGADQATLAATIMVNGTSWFFKLSGPLPAVDRERAAFKAFIQSIHFAHP